MPNHWDIIVVGGLNSDYVVRGSRLPGPGETIDGHEFCASAGGKGANQAVAAARLGARVALIGRVGADSRGDQLIEDLRRESVDTQFIFRDAKQPSGVALVMVDGKGEKQILTAPGANHRLSTRDVRKALSSLGSFRVLLMQFEVPLPAIMTAARLGRKAGANIVLDPAPPVEFPSDELFRLVDVIRPNATEAEALTGICVQDCTSARKAARALLNRGVRAVAVQAGSEGNLLVWRDGERLLPKLPVRCVDATGAGDAFAAGVAVGLAEGRAFEAAGLLGNTAAGLATTKLGAQAGLPDRATLDRWVRRQGQHHSK